MKNCIILRSCILGVLLHILSKSITQAYVIAERSKTHTLECYVAEIKLHNSHQKLWGGDRFDQPYIRSHPHFEADDNTWLIFVQLVGSKRHFTFAQPGKKSGFCRFLIPKTGSFQRSSIYFTPEIRCNSSGSNRNLQFSFYMDSLTNLFLITSESEVAEKNGKKFLGVNLKRTQHRTLTMRRAKNMSRWTINPLLMERCAF